MFPTALAIPAPIPFALDFTLEFGPVLLLALLALLDLSAVAVIRAAVVARPIEPLVLDRPRVTLVQLPSGRAEAVEASPPSRAA